MTPANLKILAYEESPLGILCLRRRELLSSPGTHVTEITLNHEFLMSSRHTESERALACTALSMHGGSQLDVLIGGLGLGYTAHAALDSHRVAHVEVVEYLPQVIEWMERGLVPLSDALNEDARLKLVQGDVYAMLARTPSRTHDVILIDVDHSPVDRLDEGQGAFYTREGLTRARAHLTPGGVLGVWSYAESSPFVEALRDVLQDVRAEPVTFENEFVGGEQTDWLFFGRHGAGAG